MSHWDFPQKSHLELACRLLVSWPAGYTYGKSVWSGNVGLDSGAFSTYDKLFERANHIVAYPITIERWERPYMARSNPADVCKSPRKVRAMLPGGFSVGYFQLGTRLANRVELSIIYHRTACIPRATGSTELFLANHLNKMKMYLRWKFGHGFPVILLDSKCLLFIRCSLLELHCQLLWLPLEWSRFVFD